MRARHSRLEDKLMVVVPVTMIMSQRIGGLLVHRPAPVTFNLSQLARTKKQFLTIYGSTDSTEMVEVWDAVHI